MAIKKLKVHVDSKQEDGYVVPVYRTIPVEKEFIKLHKIMRIMMCRLSKIDILLALYLFESVGESGVVYNSKVTKDLFLERIKNDSKGELDYKYNTIDHSFSRLRKEAIIVRVDNTDGAYWVNPAFMFVGNDHYSNKILIDIDMQEWTNMMKLQKLEMIKAE